MAFASPRRQQSWDDMEARLAEHPWLVGPEYTIADASFTPYVVRLDHLDIMGLLDRHPKVSDWYQKVRQVAAS